MIKSRVTNDYHGLLMIIMDYFHDYHGVFMIIMDCHGIIMVYHGLSSYARSKDLKIAQFVVSEWSLPQSTPFSDPFLTFLPPTTTTVPGPLEGMKHHIVWDQWAKFHHGGSHRGVPTDILMWNMAHL